MRIKANVLVTLLMLDNGTRRVLPVKYEVYEKPRHLLIVT